MTNHPFQIHAAPHAMALREVRRAVGGLMANWPFFGNLALRLDLVPDGTRKTIATDGESIRYNPEWVMENRAAVIPAVARCVLACTLKHHTRRGERDYKRWQEASRRVTLPFLADAGIRHEAGDGLDMSVEKAYEQIEADADGQGGQTPPPPAAAAPPAPPTGGPPAPSEGAAGEGAPGADTGDQGPPSHDPHGAGEIMDLPVPEGQTPGERAEQIREAEQEADKASRQATQMAKAEGKRTASIEEIIDSAGRGAAPWEDLLRRFMTASAKRDFSWRRPNHRFIGSGLYLPALYSEALPPIALLIDTSGSLDQDALAALWAEVRDIAAELEPEALTVIQCDREVKEIAEYHPLDLPETLDAKGRGGTAFSPAIAAAERQGLDHACMIYLTDGKCSDFGPEPGCDVIWAIEPRGKENFAPPFGEVIRL